MDLPHMISESFSLWRRTIISQFSVEETRLQAEVGVPAGASLMHLLVPDPSQSQDSHEPGGLRMPA